MTRRDTQLQQRGFMINAVLTSAEGVIDESNGKSVSNAADIVPDSLLGKINPLQYSSNFGRYVGRKINDGYGVVSKSVGGRGSIGSDLFELINGDDSSKMLIQQSRRDVVTKKGNKPMAALDTAKSLASRAFNFVKAQKPEIAQAVLDKVTPASAKPVEQLVQSKNLTVQAAMLKEMFAAGLSVEELEKNVGLTDAERRQYANIIAEAIRLQQAAVDAAQAPKAVTNDPYVDALITNREVEDVAQLLGLSLPQYLRVVRAINSHTEKDVERAQLAREMRG